MARRASTAPKAGDLPAPRRGVVWALLMGSELLFFLPAVLLGLSRHGRPLVPAARDLFVPAGFLVAFHGALAAMGRVTALAFPWQTTAREHRRGGWILYLIGFGMIGLGAAEATKDLAWRALSVPGILILGALCLREAFLGPRKSRFLLATAREGKRPVWLVAAGLWMFGLTWPFFVAWAVGAMKLG